MRSFLVLGATGSIGTTALEAVRKGKLPAKVAGLVAYRSTDKLGELSKEFGCPAFVNNQGPSALRDFIAASGADTALNGIAGHPGLEASLACLDAGLDLALANKESVVMGGEYLLKTAGKLGRRIIPVDSEHSAIYHLIQAHGPVGSLVITASGGPFLGRRDLDSVTPDEAADHPTWKMGRKISIDSATLANKGLEVIEAGFLFSMPADRIEVTIHRQSVVHSMVRMADGSVYAQMSPPDMTLPILSAVSDGHFDLDEVVRPLSFSNLDLTFRDWDRNEFPLLALAYECLSEKGKYPIAFNAADEVAVEAFCRGLIRFTDISRVVAGVLDSDWTGDSKSFEEIEDADARAREAAAACFRKFC